MTCRLNFTDLPHFLIKTAPYLLADGSTLLLNIQKVTLNIKKRKKIKEKKIFLPNHIVKQQSAKINAVNSK